MGQIFEIHAPDIDTDKLLADIELSLAERGHDAGEIARITELSFTPVPPAREHGFNPASVTELFERPVTAPDFSSPKFARFRGPMKWVARRLFGFFSSLHDKLNQNKIQAFYSVVHELIAVNYRHERLLERFRYLEDQQLSSRKLADDATETATYQPASPAPVPTVFARLNDELVSTLTTNLADAGSVHPILILDDLDAYLARSCRSAGLRVLRANINERERYQSFRDVAEGIVHMAPDALLAEQGDGSVGVVSLPDLGRLTVAPELFPELAYRKLMRGGLLHLRLQRGLEDSPFTPRLSCEADPRALRTLLESLGFRILQESRPQGLRDASFDLIAQKMA